MKLKGGLKTKLFFGALLVGLVLVVLSLSQGWSRTAEVNQEITGLHGTIKTLEKDNLEMKELVQYLNSDAYVEEKARTDLGLKNPDEKVVVINQDALTLTEPANIPVVGSGTDSNPQKWWHYFFN